MKLVTQKQRQFLDNSKAITDVAGAKLGTLAASNVTLGTVATANKSATQADSVAATVGALVTDFNALLAKLKAAGIML